MNAIREAAGRLAEPFNDDPIYDWAKRHVDLPTVYAIPGQFQVEKSRHLIEPFDALRDDEIREVVVYKSPQTGGTLLADIFVPYMLDTRPASCLWVFQTDAMAKSHAESRVMPVIKRCEPLKRLLPADRHKTRTQEIILNNGVPFWIQGPSIANLQSRSICILILDEVWLYKPGMVEEARNRTAAFDRAGRSKRLLISQGDEVGQPMNQAWKSGTMEDWHVACPDCGKHQWLCYQETSPAGEPIYRMKWNQSGGDIRYVCRFCSSEWKDSAELKAHFNDSGKYAVTNPDHNPEVRSFRWGRLAFDSWEALVDQYRKALYAKSKGNLIPLKVVIQKHIPDAWDPKEHQSTDVVKVATEDYNPADPWEDESRRFLTVDCQAHLTRFYAVVRAWTSGGDSRRLARAQLSSFEDIRQMQLDWKISSKFVALDSGYEATKVYRACCRYVEGGRGWTALKGDHKENFRITTAGRTEFRIFSQKFDGDPALGMRSRDVAYWLESLSPEALKLYKRGRLKAWLYMWSNPAIFEILQRLRDGQGARWVAPTSEKDDPLEIEYRKHMGNMVQVPDTDKTGREVLSWKSMGEEHFWDCEAMQLVCAIMAGCFPMSD